VYGCERSPSQDANPERVGFWTGCIKTCELTYYGGLLPKPAKLRVETYFEGHNYISISGKNDPTDVDFHHDFGWIDSEEPEWCYQEIDLNEFEGDVSVIHFNISSSSTGFVLLDRIIVDLGDKQIDPITLESKSDELPTHWSYDDCHHLDEYADFWSFGCPVEPVEESPNKTIGFWTPCTMTSCKIEFETSPSIIPTSARIRGYMENGGQIKVVVPSANPEQSTVIETISPKAGGWIDMTVDLSSYQLYKIDVVLENNGGTAMLDSLTYSFDGMKHIDNRQSDLPICKQKQATTTTTTTTTESTTTTGTTPTGTVPTGTVPTGTMPTGTASTAPVETTTDGPTPTIGTSTPRATTPTPETTTPPTEPTTESAGNSVALQITSMFPLLICMFFDLQ